MGKPWLKLWTETLHDRKLRHVEPAWRWAWVGLLMLAAENDNDGRIELAVGIPLADRDIADAIGIDSEMWSEACQYFLRLGMVHRDGETYVVTKYAKRQKKSDNTNAERQRRYRDRRRNDNTDAEVTPIVTPKVTPKVTPNITPISESESESEVDPPPPPPPTDSEPIELPDKSTPEEEDQTPVKELLANHHKHWVVSPIDAEQYERMINRFSFEEVENAQNVAISRRARTPIPYMLSVLENGPGPPSQNGRKATSEQAEDYSEWPKDGLIIRY